MNSLTVFLQLMTMATTSDIGGYEYTFIDTPTDRLVCNICHYPSREPYMTVCCGHNFCKSCLDNIRKTTCPICQSKKFKAFPNKQADREVKDLSVKCTNQERGCEWQGKVNYITDHLESSCNFEEVECSNECGETLQRQHMSAHMSECPYRDHECQYCKVTAEYCFIEGHHQGNCPKISIPCPNNCRVGCVLREDMEAHRKECPLEVIQCEYHNMGCEERMIRKNKKMHDKKHMQEHLLLTKTKYSQTEEILACTNSRVDALEGMLHYFISQNGGLSGNRMIVSAQSSIHLSDMLMTCPVTVRMSKYTRYKEDGDDWYSDPFYSHYKGYQMSMLVVAGGYDTGKDTHMSVYLCLKKGQYDAELSWPLRGRFEVKLLNQMSDYEHQTRIFTYGDNAADRIAGRVISDGRNSGNGRCRFISNKSLYEVTPTRQFIKDDAVFLQISMV